MHPALIIDIAVSKTSQLPPFLRAVLSPLLYPFVQWRLTGIATTLAKNHKWLPATTWEEVEKHGSNLVYCIRSHTDVYTERKKMIGVWVVDYSNRTVRTVSDVPKEYLKVGATF